MERSEGFLGVLQNWGWGKGDLKENVVQRLGLGNVAIFENHVPGIAAKFITKSSVFILSLGVISLLELKQNNEQKAETIFVVPPYC